MTTRDQTVATLTLRARLLRTRGVWIYFALCAGVVLMAALAVRGSYLQVTRPMLRMPLADDLTIRPVAGQWDGTENEDRLIAINGTPVHSLDDVARIERSLPEGPVTARFERGGKWINVVGTKGRLGAGHSVALVVRAIAGILLALIGAVAFLLRPGSRPSWLFFLFCWSLGMILVSFPVFAGSLVLTNTLPYSLVGVASGVAMHFFAEFPVRSKLLERWPRLTLVVHVPGALLVPAFAAAALGAIDIDTIPLWTFGMLLWGVLAAVGTLALIMSQLVRTGRSDDHRVRAQVRALGVAAVVGLLVPMVWTTVWVVGAFDFPGAVHYGTLPFVGFAAIIGYTLVRLNPFDVDRFTAAVVGYAAAAGLLGACFVTALVAMPVVLGQFGVPRSPELFVVLTSIAFVGFLPLFRRLKSRIDRWFSRTTVEAAVQADVLRELSYTVQTGDRERGMRSAAAAAIKLNAERAELWLLDPDADEFRRAHAQGAPLGEKLVPLSRHGTLAAALATADDVRGVAGLAPKILPEPAQEELWRAQLALAAPIRAHGALVGFFGIGRKLSGIAYEAAEVSFIAAIAASLGLLFEQASQDSTRVGRYRLGKRLGTGGMAEVYLAWQLGPGGFERRVALKRPLPHLMDDPAAVTMFLDEAHISAQLSHRNIVTIHEVDRQDGNYLIAMEYVEGATLRAAIQWSIRRKQPIPLPVVAAIATGILSALAYAHTASDASGRALRLVHRDVTPANVLLSLRGEVKLVDFGIARAALRKATTQTGSVKGTLYYMSPEQSAGQTVDLRSDLYSAAATIYELLTLGRAYPTGPEDRPPVPATLVRTDLPVAVDALFERALAFRPDVRPASAGELLEILLAALATPAASDDAVARWLAELSREAAQPQPEPMMTATDAGDRKRSDT